MNYVFASVVEHFARGALGVRPFFFYRCNSARLSRGDPDALNVMCESDRALITPVEDSSHAGDSGARNTSYLSHVKEKTRFSALGSLSIPHV